MLFCDKCGKNACTKMDLDNIPKRCCPSGDCEMTEECVKMYSEGEDHLIAYASAMTETCNGGRNTRVEEIIAFAKRANYHKIGLAFCMCLLEEARIFAKIMRDNGFEVHSIICKNGGISKDVLDIDYLKEHSIRSEYAMCNPIGQAMKLNDEKVQLNIILGLCVGHDTLFIKYAEAPVTYLAVKDRCTGHNPLSPIYQHTNLFERIHHMEVKFDDEL